MGLHNSRFLIRKSFLLSFAEFLHQSHRFHFQSSGESSSCTCVNDLHQLFRGEIKKLIEVDTSEHELPESSLLLQLHLCSFVGHLVCVFVFGLMCLISVTICSLIFFICPH